MALWLPRTAAAAPRVTQQTENFRNAEVRLSREARLDGVTHFVLRRRRSRAACMALVHASIMPGGDSQKHPLSMRKKREEKKKKEMGVFVVFSLPPRSVCRLGQVECLAE